MDIHQKRVTTNLRQNVKSMWKNGPENIHIRSMKAAFEVDKHTKVETYVENSRTKFLDDFAICSKKFWKFDWPKILKGWLWPAWTFGHSVFHRFFWKISEKFSKARKLKSVYLVNATTFFSMATKRPKSITGVIVDQRESESRFVNSRFPN